jgi:hypothetical protein
MPTHSAIIINIHEIGPRVRDPQRFGSERSRDSPRRLAGECIGIESGREASPGLLQSVDRRPSIGTAFPPVSAKRCDHWFSGWQIGHGEYDGSTGRVRRSARRREEDVLGRWRLAAELFGIAKETPPEWSVRIGVFAKWGEGKTTMLRFLEQMAVGESYIPRALRALVRANLGRSLGRICRGVGRIA